MRFLKTKIHLARKALEQKLAIQESSKLSPSQDPVGLSIHKENSNRSPVESDSNCHTKAPGKKAPSTDKCADTKNISINYGRAIITFAKSPLAKPYLESYFQEDRGLLMSEFIHSMSRVKYSIKGIHSLRSMLLIEEKDNDQEAALKRAFQWICEIFIKYFSVNWIMHGKMTHKMTYLKYRSKMLRRVQKPELFTYVRESRKIQVKDN